MNRIVVKSMGFYLNALAIINPKGAAKKSFDIFCTPIAPKLKDHQQEFLSRASQLQIMFEGKLIQGYQWGNGPKKVYFFHGWQSHAYRWMPYIEALSFNEYTVYAFDGPAHGNSEGKTFNIPMYQRLIIQIMDEMGKPYAVAGHSMGGFSSIYAFYEQPQLSPEKLIVMGAPVLANDFVTEFQIILGLTDRVKNNMITYFIETLGHPPEFYDSRAFVKTLSSRGLLIHDVSDDRVPVDYARQVANQWQNVSYWETNGYGHRLRDPEVVKRVIDFIEQ